MVYHNLYPRIEYCSYLSNMVSASWLWRISSGGGGGGDWSQSEKAKKLRMNNNDNDNDDNNDKIIIVIIIITIVFFLGVSFYSHRSSLLSVTQWTPAGACNENKTRHWKRNLFSSQVITCIWEDLSRAIIQWRYRPITSNKWRYGIHKYLGDGFDRLNSFHT